MLEAIKREAIYLWYYFDIQLRQIVWYWVLGILLGSAISVFAKKWIHQAAEFFGRKIPGVVGLVFASALGIASPLCMYGTIPICAAFSKKGIKDDFLASFMMSSILLNPQLIIYSGALGAKIVAVRICSCFLCGIVAGLLVRAYCVRDWNGAKQTRDSELGAKAEPWKARLMQGARLASGTPEENDKTGCGGRSYFDFSKFDGVRNNDTDKNMFLRYVKNVMRNVRATGLWFLAGIALSAVFQRYVPADLLQKAFGGNKAWGVLMAATIGVPLYVCGGGTIPLLMDWLSRGMSVGSVAAFMITGPATKITNLGALKIALGFRHFAMYVLFVILFSLVTGLVVNAML